MTDKLLIDRATLEQMVGMLEKAENAMAYGTPVDGDKLDEMIAKGRAALANAEPAPAINMPNLRCNKVLMANLKPYPRTCAECGITGPCKEMT